MAYGWMVHGVRTSADAKGRHMSAIKGQRGFPDLLLCRGSSVIFLELKRKPNTLEPAQIVWRDRLLAAGADWRLVWVPEEQDSFLASLR